MQSHEDHLLTSQTVEQQSQLQRLRYDWLKIQQSSPSMIQLATVASTRNNSITIDQQQAQQAVALAAIVSAIGFNWTQSQQTIADRPFIPEAWPHLQTCINHQTHQNIPLNLKLLPGSTSLSPENGLKADDNQSITACEYVDKDGDEAEKNFLDVQQCMEQVNRKQLEPHKQIGSKINHRYHRNSLQMTANQQQASSKLHRVYRCRHCDFETDKKVKNWQHIRIHIRPDKLLACQSCQFVTEYKHHLEYHQRNHSGHKPFKCGHCDYHCVNKSMLNSHLKSHSPVCQYKCGDCNYATKYIHSLKMHLRKYSHQPSQSLDNLCRNS